MSSEADQKSIKSTQDLLTKIIKKPILTDKLLKRPPFRFLHDIITSIIKSNDFMKELYSSDEMVAENLKDKDAKIVYLQKAIDVTGFIIGDVVSVKPSKIVAGLESDKTNLWLQTLAKAVINKKDSSDAVKKVLNGEKPIKKLDKNGTNIANKKKEVNDNTKSVNKKKTNPLPKDTKNEVKSKVKTESTPLRSKEKVKASPKSSNESIDNAVKSVKQSANKNIENHIEKSNSNDNNLPVKSFVSDIKDSIKKDNVHNDVVNGNATAEEINRENQSNDEKLNSSAKSSTHFVAEVSVRPPTRQESLARPSSSRPAPPRVSSKKIEETKLLEAEMEEKMRQQSVKPIENLIIEKTKNEDDEDFIINDTINLDETDVIINEQLGDSFNNEQKGSLVKQLVETKKELEGNASLDVQLNEKATTRLANRDIEKLRQSIQSLSQCANPLGKVLDYLQEDIDAMVSELKIWHDEYMNNMSLLEKSRANINHDLEPLKDDLNLLDKDIAEQLEKIIVTKANIIRNEDKIQKMVTMINKTF